MMTKTITALVLLAVSMSALSAPLSLWTELAPNIHRSSGMAATLGDVGIGESTAVKMSEEKACRLNICAAIDGSSSIASKEFAGQQNFVLDAIHVIGTSPSIRIAAAEYSTSVSEIFPLQPYKGELSVKLENFKQSGGKSFLAGGIEFCVSQLKGYPKDANLMLVLGDADENVGSGAVAQADEFRKNGGMLRVVVAGRPIEKNSLEIAGGNYSHILESSSFIDVLHLDLEAYNFKNEVCNERD